MTRQQMQDKANDFVDSHETELQTEAYFDEMGDLTHSINKDLRQKLNIESLTDKLPKEVLQYFFSLGIPKEVYCEEEWYHAVLHGIRSASLFVRIFSEPTNPALKAVVKSYTGLPDLDDILANYTIFTIRARLDGDAFRKACKGYYDCLRASELDEFVIKF